MERSNIDAMPYHQIDLKIKREILAQDIPADSAPFLLQESSRRSFLTNSMFLTNASLNLLLNIAVQNFLLSGCKTAQYRDAVFFSSPLKTGERLYAIVIAGDPKSKKYVDLLIQSEPR